MEFSHLICGLWRNVAKLITNSPGRRTLRLNHHWQALKSHSLLDCVTHLIQMLHDVLDDITACFQVGTDSDHATIFVFDVAFSSFIGFREFCLWFFEFCECFRDEKQEENVGKLRKLINFTNKMFQWFFSLFSAFFWYASGMSLRTNRQPLTKTASTFVVFSRGWKGAEKNEQTFVPMSLSISVFCQSYQKIGKKLPKHKISTLMHLFSLLKPHFSYFPFPPTAFSFFFAISRTPRKKTKFNFLNSQVLLNRGKIAFQFFSFFSSFDRYRTTEKKEKDERNELYNETISEWRKNGENHKTSTESG